MRKEIAALWADKAKFEADDSNYTLQDKELQGVARDIISEFKKKPPTDEGDLEALDWANKVQNWKWVG